MTSGESRTSRRALLMATGGGTVIGLAGCINTPGDVPGYPQGSEQGDWCLDDLTDDVPESEATALSVDGIDRKDEEELVWRRRRATSVDPSELFQCSTCRFYIDDRDGDGIGACTEVAGQIRSVDWCGLFQEKSELANE
ncbi:MAG: High potential iron-sulfur protein [Natrialbaceae archaeon]|nr:High potential iron-sulfur protein [Natrialbaceae archaeon]